MIITINNQKMDPIGQDHLDIVEDALERGFINEAEELLSLFTDNTKRADDLRKRIKAASMQQQMQENSQLDCISNDPSMQQVPLPEVDPEKEMIKNTIIMRVRLLMLEGKLAYSNKAENVLDLFDVGNLGNFYSNMTDVGHELMTTMQCFDADNLDDANMYLKKAEQLFLMVCPERLRKKIKKTEGPSKINDNILKDVKPKDYQPLPRDELTVVGNWEDVKKCITIAAKAMAEQKYEKAKRMAEKAERIHSTPAAKALLHQIRIVTEARVEAAKRAKERAENEAAEKAINEIKAAKIAADKAERQAAKTAAERARKEATEKEKKGVAEKAKKETAKHEFYQENGSNFEKEHDTKVANPDQNSCNDSGAEPTKRHADSEPVTNSPETTKKRRAEGCLAHAQDAFSKGDISKAERLAKKAQKIKASEETDRFLMKIQKELSRTNEKNENADPNIVKKSTENTVKNDVKSDINNLLKKVKECLSSERLDDAEQALRDIKSSEPTVDVQSLESQIRAAKASRSSTDNIHLSYPEIKPNDPKSRAQKNSESFLGIAKNAMAAGDYIKAEEFLKKANGQCPSDATEKLLQQVQIQLFSKNQNNARENTLAENKAEAESFYERAEKALSNKKFDEALELAVQSQKSHRLRKAEVLKKEIIKQRNDFDENNKLIKDPDNVDKAIGLITQANAEIKENNMEKAEQLLVQSLQIHKTQSAKDILNEIGQCESEPIHDRKPRMNFGPNHEVQKCLNITETAMKDNDLEKAERYLNKSLRITTSNAVKQIQVEALKTSQETTKPESRQKSNDENIITAVRNDITADHEQLTADVEKCIQVATNAISAEDLEKAERFLKKAQRIQPTEQAKELLDSIQEGIEHKKKEEQTRLANEAKAEPLVACAVTAISEELYDVAEIILMNAWIKHKSSTAKQMIGQVEDIINQADAENAKTGKKKNKDKSVDDQNETADRVFELAKNMMTDSDEHLESVECLLIIARNILPTKHAKELLTHIRKIILSNSQNRLKTKNEFNYSKITPINRKSFKCNNYVQMAQSAFESGDYIIAKEFLLEAEKVIPAKGIKKLIKQVDEAKKQKENSDKKHN